jgi:hypothetical protein
MVFNWLTMNDKINFYYQTFTKNQQIRFTEYRNKSRNVVRGIDGKSAAGN